MQVTRMLVVAALLSGSVTLTLALPRRIFVDQERTQSTAKEADHPKSEVERMLEDANKRGEHIYATCIEPCDEQSSTKTTPGLEEGGALVLPHPAYPAIAAAAHASGSVQVQVIIDEEGNVIAAHAISGHPLLQATSVAAARKARFKPSKLSGSPVKVTGVIVYNFVQ